VICSNQMEKRALLLCALVKLWCVMLVRKASSVMIVTFKLIKLHFRFLPLFLEMDSDGMAVSTFCDFLLIH